MEKVFGQAERINFGALPPEIDDLLQQGVAAYRHDRARADRLFRQALSQKPTELAPYYCLYKIHTYMGSLEVAKEIAVAGLKEAVRQAGWSENPSEWPDGNLAVRGPRPLRSLHAESPQLHRVCGGETAKPPWRS